MDINGTTYAIKRHRVYGRYVQVPVENLTVGMKIDQGTFVGRTESYAVRGSGDVNPNTWEVWLADGLSYVETRGATVRVWI